MFHVRRFRLFHAGRRALRRERVFRDRTKPLDIYDDFELIDKYRFDRQSIMMICDMLQDDLESSTFRNRAYFFMFYLHDISIQSLKLVSYITVERKILQIDEGGASKFKSGKLRNIMIVCPC
jgi:hypothetical protein